jgi:hypothetical protein
MSFVQRLVPRATLSVRRKADKQTVDALESLGKWAEAQPNKHQNGETLRLLNRALLLDDGNAVTQVYGRVSRLRESGRDDVAFMGLMELLQDKLLEKLDIHTRER